MAVGVGILWTLYVVLSRFGLTTDNIRLLNTVLGVVIIVVIVTNHIRMYLFIRKQRVDVLNAVSSQQTQEVLRREKKVALSMFIVTINVFLSTFPVEVLILGGFSDRVFFFLYPWGLTLVMLSSSVNPVIFWWRNKDLRKAVNSLVIHNVFAC